MMTPLRDVDWVALALLAAAILAVLCLCSMAIAAAGNM